MYSLGLVTGWLSDRGNASLFVNAMTEDGGVHIGRVEIIRDMLTASMEEAMARMKGESRGEPE